MIYLIFLMKTLKVGPRVRESAPRLEAAAILNARAVFGKARVQRCALEGVVYFAVTTTIRVEVPMHEVSSGHVSSLPKEHVAGRVT
jgi:hypothetical protein